MAEGPAFRDLLSNEQNRRRAAWRYWARDTAQGSLNLAIHHGLRALPTDLCSAFGAQAARLSPLRYPESEARARRLWQRLHPQASSPPEVDAAMRRLWRSVGRTMAEYSVLHRLCDEGRVEIVGAENLTMSEGRPMIGAALHLGNWELIGVVATRLGYTGGGTYEPPENRFDRRIAADVRRRYGGTPLTPSLNTAVQAYELLRQGQNFLFYLDEINEDRVSAPAFGRAQRLRGNIANAVRLARLADARIIVTYCERLGDAARFRVHFLPPLRLARDGGSRSDLAANVAKLDAVITPIIAARLDQWYYTLDFEPDPS